MRTTQDVCAIEYIDSFKYTFRFIYIDNIQNAIANKVFIKIQNYKVQEDEMFQKTLANDVACFFIIVSFSLAYPYRAISFQDNCKVFCYSFSRTRRPTIVHS